ncbi:MAG TPA: hypothetical protein VF508_01870 [Pyrinomonadaceae bacterium]|jgi:hypothetical protein
MKLLKLLFALVALLFLVWGAFWLFGLVAALFKWLVILGVVALVGVGAYKLLAGPDEDEPAALSPAEAEMLKAERMLAELRRKQLTK